MSRSTSARARAGFRLGDGRYASCFWCDEFLDVVAAHACRQRGERMRPRGDVAASPEQTCDELFASCDVVFGGRGRGDDGGNLNGLESCSELGVARHLGVGKT
jgi:hypothetical protein